MKASQLSRSALDAQVALALGWSFREGVAPPGAPDCGHRMWHHDQNDESWRCTICNRLPLYSSDWVAGGPVIEVFRVGLVPSDLHPLATHNLLPKWQARHLESRARNRQPLRAAMEALVRSLNPGVFEAEA